MLKVSILPVIILNGYFKASVSPKAMIIAIKLNRIDSIKNCQTNSFLEEPNDFLTPTSKALLDPRAVARFIKLIHAMTIINKAIAENIYTYEISELIPISARSSEFR